MKDMQKFSLCGWLTACKQLQCGTLLVICSFSVCHGKNSNIYHKCYEYTVGVTLNPFKTFKIRLHIFPLAATLFPVNKLRECGIR